MSKQQLIIGDNYRGCFGLKENQGMIYMGGDAWKMVCPVNGEKVVESPKTTESALEYINRARINMGM